MIVPAYVKYLSELIPRAYKRLPGKIFLRLYTQEDVGIVDWYYILLWIQKRGIFIMWWSPTFCTLRIFIMLSKCGIFPLTIQIMNTRRITKSRQKGRTLVLALAIFFEERRTFEGLMSLWTTHLSVPLCKYSMASEIPTATLYLIDQASVGQPLCPFVLSAERHFGIWPKKKSTQELDKFQIRTTSKQKERERHTTMQMELQASTRNILVDQEKAFLCVHAETNKRCDIWVVKRACNH